jgi:pyridoxal 5'-phosphate synthase pdxT subunit
VKNMKVGILALQGAFIEHAKILRTLGVEISEIRLAEQLEDISGLIIPGGESTTIGKLSVQYDLLGPLRRFAATKPVWGTCAGMILLAKKTDADQPLLGVIDIVVQRNAFGPQKDSFETALQISVLDDGMTKPFPAIFIRAPRITALNGRAAAIATLPDGAVVAVQEGKCLATAFHPELTQDRRFHRYFLQMIRNGYKK